MPSSKHSSEACDKTSRSQLVWVSILLALLTFGVYAQVSQFDFVSYDDPDYTDNNRHTRDGITKEGLVWAFTHSHAANWFPLTWISHMVDCHLFGLNAGPHHLVNLGIHTTSTVLLFLVLFSMVRTIWPCAFVAALFGLHPLHVESVAWIAERKDVLSAFFWILTIGAYARYVQDPKPKKYLLALTLFGLGLMSKPMLVTLPFVLLLLDFWPLNRFQVEIPKSSKRNRVNTSDVLKDQFIRLSKEKIPFFALTVLSCVITFFAQRADGAVWSMEKMPLAPRLANAVVSYFRYIGKMIWPFDLSVFYPIPEAWAPWQVGGSLLLLISISVFAFRARDRHPYLFVGWFWYMGTLVPVIGIVQVGLQSMADRYTYIPMIGLSMAVIWGIVEAFKHSPQRLRTFGIVGGLIMIAFTARTWDQLQHWRNTNTLFEHALKVTEGNYVAHTTLGLKFSREGKAEEAIAHFNKSLAFNPYFTPTLINMGLTLANQGKTQEASEYYSKALSIDAKNSELRLNLAALWDKEGKKEEAFKAYSELLNDKKVGPEAHNNLGHLLFDQGKVDEAISHYREALRLKSVFPQAHFNLGEAFKKQGKLEESQKHYAEAMRLEPSADVHYNRGIDFVKENKFEEAAKHFAEAARLKPGDGDAHYNLALSLTKIGQMENSLISFQDALRVKTEDSQTRYQYALALIQSGKNNEAETQLREALRLKPQWPMAMNALANVLVVTSKPNFSEAMQLAQQACELTKHQQPTPLLTLASIYAEMKRFSDAAQAAQKALALLKASGQTAVIPQVPAGEKILIGPAQSTQSRKAILEATLS
jgi:protein O-mannosyl-transferase